MKSDYLKITNLTKVYDAGAGEKLFALSGLELSVNEGDFVTIVGNNAAGKSTLFKLITGTVAPTTGTVVLDNISLLNLDEIQKAKIISCVKQNPNDGVINSMSVAENLAMVKLKNLHVGLRVGVKKEWREEFISLLTPIGIGLERRLDDITGNLSGGQKQTVALLMATLTKPKLLMLDEHTAALDPKVSKVVLKTTNEVVSDNKITTLMITHDIHQAIEYGNRLILLQKGKVRLDICGEKKRSLSVRDLEGYYENQE